MERKPILASKAVPASPRAARRAGSDYGKTAEPSWREVEWSSKLRQVVVNGRKVNYVDLGEGDAPSVVFVHGLGGQWQNFLENIPRMARERRTLALDLPGFGFSEMPVEDVSIPGYARTVNEFCEKLGLDHVVLVGNSMGGFVSAETAIQFPQRVERLVLVSPAGITSANVRKRPLMTLVRIGVAVSTASMGRSKNIARRPVARHYALAWVARHPSRLAADLVYEGLMLGQDKPGFFPALEANLDYDFRDRLGEIGCPTLLVWGRNDGIIPVSDAEEYARLVPGIRKVILDDTGHIAMVERPETFNRMLLDFLSEGPGESATPDEAPLAEPAPTQRA